MLIGFLTLTLLALCLFIFLTISSNKAASAYDFSGTAPANSNFNTLKASVPKSKIVFYPSKNGQISSKGLSQADYIFEYLNPNGSIYYQAIFDKELPKNITPTENHNSVFLMPEFNYKTSENIHLSLTKPAASIFVTFSSLLSSSSSLVSSNFIYSNFKYYHYKDKSKDIDELNNTPVCVSNVIVQISNTPVTENNLNSIKGNGTGYLFTGGKGVEIKWNKEDSNPIKILDSNNNPVFLNKGSTWWIIIDNDSSVVFN